MGAHLSRVILIAVPAALFAAACTDDDPDGPVEEPGDRNAVFSTADSATMRRVLRSIQGNDVLAVTVVGMSFSGDDRAGCPAVVSEGPVTTVTGGCSNDEGVRVDGRLVLTNVRALGGNPAVDPTRPGTIEAFGWQVTSDLAYRMDGRVVMTAVDGDPARGQTLEADVDVELDGFPVHAELALVDDDQEFSTYQPGSWIHLDGIGSADLSGTFRATGVLGGNGVITATGAETLTYEVFQLGDCDAYSIDGGPLRCP